MMDAGGIYYSVDIETAETVNATKRVNKELDNLQSGMDRADKAATNAEKGVSKFGKGASNAASEASGLTAKLTPLASAIAGVITVQTLMNMQQLGERFNLLQARITRLSSDTKEAAATYRTLLNISSQTGASVGDTVQLWESLTGTLKEMGQTNDQVLRLTGTLQKIGTLGGSSAQDMSNALRQLSQGLAGGVIRAEEFNSVLEGMPELARQIAKGLGIPFSELRQRMLDGKLTAEDVLSAIEKRTQAVDQEFAKIPRTVAQASNAIVNEMGAAIATLDKATNASSALAKVLDAIAKGIRLTSGNLTDQERLNTLFAERQKIIETIRNTEGTWREMLPGTVALTERKKKLDEEILAIQNKRIEQQKKENAEQNKASGGGTASAPTTSEGGQKVIESLRQQAELAKLTGEERAKLAAVQKLGADATEEEKVQAAALAAEIYRLNEAQKAATASRREGIAESKKEAAEAQKLADLREKAEQQQRKAARERMEKQQSMLGQADPLVGEQQKFETELANLRTLNEAKLLEDQRYLELKAQAEAAHAQQMQVLREQDFAAQSATNALLLDSLNQIQQGATDAFVGILTGATNSREAVQQLAQSILKDAIGALVKMGIENVKAIVMGQAAQTAAAGTAAATGAAMTASYAPAAAAASVASFGGAAGAGLAALASAIPAAIGLFSGKALGGPVQANQMYRVNETGAPEIFNAANGRQYMMPNQRGDVVSNKDATSGGGGSNVVINITNNTGAQVSTSESQVDNQRIIDVVVGDMMSDGRIAQATNRITGTQRGGQ